MNRQDAKNAKVKRDKKEKSGLGSVVARFLTLFLFLSPSFFSRRSWRLGGSFG
jgi:hypothetical protein